MISTTSLTRSLTSTAIALLAVAMLSLPASAAGAGAAASQDQATMGTPVHKKKIVHTAHKTPVHKATPMHAASMTAPATMAAPAAASTDAKAALPDDLINVGTPDHPVYEHDANNGAYANYTQKLPSYLQ
ncbi:hypothetical protein SAMN02745172_00196 [Pseudoxanthobacter soli DSM 19599]|uniref:Uncharacterized protein n=1 Tax=Pseudoxanthobacter soli DSM 19599 TaxID=1123029 RepID=A0A1M7Z5J0_9HYPH|nr:hypothetical protein [Pseudoxanthobacter soli]SHO60151.1 hypothetical protein SAMN02745172_00196 [Pseudoxanthobacter soli DSM 19599]